MPRNVIDDLPPIKTGPLIMYMTCWVVAGPPLRPGREGGIKCQRYVRGAGSTSHANDDK